MRLLADRAVVVTESEREGARGWGGQSEGVLWRGESESEGVLWWGSKSDGVMKCGESKSEGVLW